MTTEEHLKRIVAKCRENLELAAKRTPGRWDRDKSGGLKGDVRCESGQWVALTSFVGNSDRGGLPHQEANAAYISACAGSAEAGWRATIAMCERIMVAMERAKGGDLHENEKIVVSTYTAAADLIIATWPEELLS